MLLFFKLPILKFILLLLKGSEKISASTTEELSSEIENNNLSSISFISSEKLILPQDSLTGSAPVILIAPTRSGILILTSVLLFPSVMSITENQLIPWTILLGINGNLDIFLSKPNIL